MASSKFRAELSMLKRDNIDDSYVWLRECLLRNIILLGFNESTIAKKNRITMERDSFVLPNKPLFDSVLYFIFIQLDKKKTENEFRVCWPVLDRKQDIQFRKTSIEFLRTLSLNEISLPQNMTSLFLSPNGRKFYSFLLHLTNHTLAVKLKRMTGPIYHLVHNAKEPKTKEEIQSIWKLYETSTKMHLDNYLRSEEEKLLMYQTSKNEIKHQERIYSELLNKIEEKKKSIRSKEERLTKYNGNLSDENNQLDTVVSELKTNVSRLIETLDDLATNEFFLYQVNESWQIVDDVCDRSKEQIECLSYLTENYDKYILDGTKLSTTGPIQLIDVDSGGLDVNGNVRLEHLVSTFNKGLNLYSSKLRNVLGCKKRNLESVSNHRDLHNELSVQLQIIHSKLVPLAAELKSSSETLFQEAVSQSNSETWPPSLSPPNSRECIRDLLPLTPKFELYQLDSVIKND